MNIAINGLGRIGRNFLRSIMLDPKAQETLNVVAINIGPAKKSSVAYMFKYDTIMGTYPGSVVVDGDYLIIDGMRIHLIAELDPDRIDWSAYPIEWVVECTGRFTACKDALRHCASGAQHVLISAPAHDEDITIIPGVNEDMFDPQKHRVVSLGSCTTNAFITMLKVLHDAFSIQSGFMTTVHAYTNSQVLLDVEVQSDIRRSRAAALNIIPTTTGAARMVGKMIPELEGRINATAIRVPVANVSLIDFSFVTSKLLSVSAIHDAIMQVMHNRMKGIIQLSKEPLVSSDFIGSSYSIVIDGLLTVTQENIGKVSGWYDNEWGYSMRLKDFLLSV